MSATLLNDHWARLLDGLAASANGRFLIELDDPAAYSQTAIDRLAHFQILKQAEPARSVVCDGCEQRCPMPVEIVRTSDGKSARAYVICETRDDMGPIPVWLDRLRQWSISLDSIANMLAAKLRSDRKPVEIEPSLVFDLGRFTIGKQGWAAFLAVSDRDIPPHVITDKTLVVTLVDPAPSWPHRWVALRRLIAFSEQGPVIMADVLKSALPAKSTVQRIAWEIAYDEMTRQITLHNRVTGTDHRLAKPRTSSNNESLFLMLWERPNRHLTRADMAARIDDADRLDLHKFTENLNFTGDLKKAFFDVSKDKILFRPRVTLADLKRQAIDPKSITQ